MPMKLPRAARDADQLLDGALKAKLRAWRKEGLSWQGIADQLHSDTGGEVSVTDQALTNWARCLGIPTKRPSTR